MNRPTLALRASQQLALTPQLQQSIRLLQLSTLELASEVEQMLADNPFLEQDEDDGDAPGPHAAQPAGTPAADAGPEGDAGAAHDGAAEPAEASELLGAAEPLEWEGEGAGDSDWGHDAPGRSGSSGDGEGELDALELASHHETLAEHLTRQALSLHLAPEDAAALALLIGSLNDDGYLMDAPAELADALLGDGAWDPERHAELLHRLTVALGLLQSMEPAGVGARDLAECLALQLRARQALGQDDAELTRVALAVCRQPLDWLARRDVRRLSHACSADEEATRAAIALIARLEPKPGRRFADVRRMAVVPDVIVKRGGSGAQQRFAVQLNPAVMPRLRVHELYAGALRTHRGGEGHPQLQARLQEARWFIKNVQQRFDTILRVSDAIVQRQKNFFVHGELAMRPLVLRDIAEELGLHESTISRVTTAKYMATPQGTYELKYFFGSGLGTETGGNASSTAVRALIRQFVAAEDPAKPLSDSKIADLLKEQGIECARRTVAKYREALRIAPANLRKTL
ncbi:RNA polymerase sigma-54 factor [Melaminivora suipulveris]|uniref:RNA polymerase sigma-54 factor n=1 Tax=Melaminivora suipulveris TaxID=2109913 RepID=A0A2R3QBC6_9BURK|nr:RNA polymerase factor sigma-54 [Melaminivora suipulveris]AVO49093.1 RNA polymerase sigma-54 factor [Melaminivora suipulveris]